MKRVQLEPHLSVTGACSAEWIPIKPKTDSAFLFAMIHVLLHEHAREKLDIPFLKERTSSPYLIAPGGFFLRDAELGQLLLVRNAFVKLRPLVRFRKRFFLFRRDWFVVGGKRRVVEVPVDFGEDIHF